MNYDRNHGIDVGRMNERITIQKPSGGRQPSGQLNPQPEGWEDVCTIWAEARCVLSGAADEAGISQHETEFRFYIRRRSDITAEMRILWLDHGRERIFLLQGPPVDWQNRQGLTLIGRELVQYGTR